MARRLIFLAAMALAIVATPVVVSAQSSPPPSVSVTTPTTGPPTTVPPTSPPSVKPTIVHPSTPGSTAPGASVPAQKPPTQVKGVVVNRPLPRTGNDFGLQVILGGGLTAAGLAFAVSARLRRQRVTAHAS
jgi:hypothetical protein